MCPVRDVTYVSGRTNKGIRSLDAGDGRPLDAEDVLWRD
jgi:hypothetical protein